MNEAQIAQVEGLGSEWLSPGPIDVKVRLSLYKLINSHAYNVVKEST